MCLDNDSRNLIDMKREKIECYHYADFLLEHPKGAKEVYLLLHGFGETAKVISKRIKKVLPKDQIILSPNGFFPIPQRTEEGFKMGYAWYFFDPVKHIYYIDYDVPATFLENLLKKLNIDNLPLTIIGYSQGGYLAPFVGQKLNSTKHVIGINCNYKYEMYEYPVNFRIDALNGMKDDMVDPFNAQKSFEKLKEKGIEGSFFGLEEEDHRLSKAFLDKIQDLIM